MSSLTQFRDHCQAMSVAEHKPGCQEAYQDAIRKLWMARQWGPGWGEPAEPPAKCEGCVTDADRALFAQLAGEVDNYLNPQPDLFGNLTPEPESAR